MTFALKALLEDKGLLAEWKEHDLKEAESHNLLEQKLHDLVTSGVLTQAAEDDFKYVKEERWKCDYSIYAFNMADAKECVKRMEDFYLTVEIITTHYNE